MSGYISQCVQVPQVCNPGSLDCCDRCPVNPAIFHGTIELLPKALSLRGQDFSIFSMKMPNYIEGYTVPQYGDKGDDQCTDFTVQDFVTQIKKYINRFGKNSRPGQDKLDLLKIAHYAQMAADRLSDTESKTEA